MQNKECKQYEFAGVIFELVSPEFEAGEYLEKFCTENQDTDITYHIEFCEHIQLENETAIHSDLGNEVYQCGEHRIRVIRYDSTDDIVMMDIEKNPTEHEVYFSTKHPKSWGETIVTKIMNIPRKMILHGGIFLHASFVVWNGEAILFSGKKQIGKSTQARLWKEEKDVLIANGDRVILKHMDGRWYACGSPYCGTSKICENVKVPVRCIVLLEQGVQNHITDVGIRDAFVSLLKNCSYEAWDKVQMDRALQIMEQISSEVSFAKLTCLPERSSVKVLEEYLCQKKK